MPRIDIDEVLREKAPRFAKYIPRFVRNWLRRTIHEEALNDILAAGWNRPPQEFIHVAFERMRIAYRIDGLERLDPAERYLFVANHPFGGLDGMMIADALIERFGDARVVVNDLLMHVEPLQPIWLPVNKHGRQTAAYARRYDEAFAGDLPILTFPAGLCSRRRGGVVSDTPWRLNFSSAPTLRGARSYRSTSKAGCRTFSTASRGCANGSASNSTSRCSGFPTRCSARAEAASVSWRAIR